MSLYDERGNNTTQPTVNTGAAESGDTSSVSTRQQPQQRKIDGRSIINLLCNMKHIILANTKETLLRNSVNKLYDGNYYSSPTVSFDRAKARGNCCYSIHEYIWQTVYIANGQLNIHCILIPLPLRTDSPDRNSTLHQAYRQLANNTAFKPGDKVFEAHLLHEHATDGGNENIFTLTHHANITH